MSERLHFDLCSLGQIGQCSPPSRRSPIITAGYAALTLMEPDEEVVAADFTINLLRPSVGPSIVAEAQVIRVETMLQTICRVKVSPDDQRAR